MNIEFIKEQFTKYVETFGIEDRAIFLKYNHSFRVMNLCEKIAKSLNLNDEGIYLSCVIGLLHDYGRFEQWKKFKLYSDVKTVYHADLSIKLLFDEGQIEQFQISKKYYDIIYDAIKYHNKLMCPQDLNECNSFFVN